MRRGRVAILACSLLIGVAGCGGDDTAAETATTESTPTATQTAPTATSTAPQATTPAPATTTPPTTSGSSGGGATVPADPSKPDSAENDTKPPAGSPAERFEQQCQANPQTCGD